MKEKNRILTIENENGQKVQIKILDFFAVDEYPNRQYVAYVFVDGNENKQLTNDDIYISVITVKGNNINFEAITDKNEIAVLKEAFIDYQTDKDGE